MKYTLTRKILVLLGKEFRITDEQGIEVAYAKQKAFKLREELTIFSNSTMTEELVKIKARNILDFGATYDITDSKTGEKLGALRRMGIKSMFRDEWRILTAGDNEVGYIQEESGWMAFVRRFVTNLIPQRYDLRIGGTDAGGFEQVFSFIRYILEIDCNESLLDKRIAFAAAVLLGAIEGRQE